MKDMGDWDEGMPKPKKRKPMPWWIMIVIPCIVAFSLGWLLHPQPDPVQTCVAWEEEMTACPYCLKKLTIRLDRERLPGIWIDYGYKIQVVMGWPKDMQE